MKKKNPKRHHLVPRFMLMEFVSAEDNRTLWALNTAKLNKIAESGMHTCNLLESGLVYRTSVNNASVISNFYSNPNLDDSVKEEKRISKIESDAAPIYKEVLQTSKMPKREKKKILLAFIANLYNRTQWSRSIAKALSYDIAHNAGNPKNEFHKLMCKRIFGETLNIEGLLIWSQLVEYANSEYCWSELNSVEEGRYLKNFMQLHWRIEIAPEGSNFICSDAPVFCWSKLDSYKFVFDTNGFILCPLSKNLLLIGYKEITNFPCLGETQFEKEFMTGYVNALTFSYADKHIFGNEPIPRCFYKGTIEYLGLAKFFTENFAEVEYVKTIGGVKTIPNRYPTMDTMLKREVKIDRPTPVIPNEIMKMILQTQALE